MSISLTDQISSSLYEIRKNGTQQQQETALALTVGWGDSRDADLYRAALLRTMELDIRDAVKAA